MKSKTGSRLIACALLAALAVGASARVNKDSAKSRRSEAKVSWHKAMTKALEKVPGHLVSSKLERKKGKLVYSFDIATGPAAIEDVQIDAITGEVVSVEHETVAQEAAEKRQESKKAKQKKH